MSSSSDEEDMAGLPNDEVREIKRAMVSVQCPIVSLKLRHVDLVSTFSQRVAKARKQALSRQMKLKLDKTSADQCELESMLRKQGSELQRMKSLLSQTDFDLKEARFELNQMQERETALKEEKRVNDARNAEIIAELRSQLEAKNKLHEERTQIALFECDKMVKTLSSLYKSVFDSRNPYASSTPKTTKQLMDKATRDAEHLREFLQSKSSALLNEEHERAAVLRSGNHRVQVRLARSNILCG
jgi:septal ring factor EnvC (AmiA/AmiB activator)